jgi:TonB family protein
MSELDPSPKTSARLWIAAALGAVAIHAGCVALAMAYMAVDEDDDALGAPAIEIDLERAAPWLDPADLPPGPEAEATAPSPAVVEQKANLEKTELPNAVPTETDDPDRLVAPDPSQHPKDEPTVTAVQANPSRESVATEATAMPSSETVRESTRSVAPAPGTGDSAQRVRVTWQKQLVAHFDKHKRYPADRRRQAEIVVSFVLDRSGHILSTSIVQGSGDRSFDDAALAMLRRSDPVPPPPPLIADEGLSFTLPVIFRVNGRK